MTFKEYCEKVGGNYDDIVKRFEKEISRRTVKHGGRIRR